MPQYKVCLARFPYPKQEHPDCTDWVVETMLKMAVDPRIGLTGLQQWKLSDTPITMARNRCLDDCERNGTDYLLMIDSDMNPDVQVPNWKPFWETSWEFMLEHKGPCVIGAPYCGPPPLENPYIFKWTNHETDNVNPDFKLECYTRHETLFMRGIQPCAALPTGLMLIDMKAIKGMPHPRFYYEYTDEKQTKKASTEDVSFTRDLALNGIPLYANWDSWAGHWKPKLVIKPLATTFHNIRSQLMGGAELDAKLKQFETRRLVPPVKEFPTPQAKWFHNWAKSAEREAEVLAQVPRDCELNLMPPVSLEEWNRITQFTADATKNNGQE